jgi:crossover junction endodeoxyribonuclease RuvC
MRLTSQSDRPIILAIDPGSLHVGWSLISGDHRQMIYLASGTLHLPPEDSLFERIKKISIFIHELIAKYRPQELAMESLIFVKSPTALIKLAQARGAILAAGGHHNLSFYEYAPTQVKAASGGHGHIEKKFLKKWIEQKFQIPELQSTDESDALAVGICHLQLKNSVLYQQKLPAKSKKRSLSAALKHKIAPTKNRELGDK